MRGEARGRLHYGWVVVGVTAAALLISAGVRSAPGVLVHPLGEDLGWGRAAISFSVSVGLLVFGLAGPLVGRLLETVGPRRLLLGGLLLVASSTAAGAAMTALWQFTLLWGVLNGVGTGVAATVLGATVANRWFARRRGLVIGLFGAATSAGQLLFIPALQWLVLELGWRGGTLALALAALLALVPVFLLMRDDPSDVGLRPYGAPPPEVVEASAMQPVAAPVEGGGVMRRAARTPEFWLLAGSFFICGATSNGLIGVHFIPHSIDHGIPAVAAAGTLALMGLFKVAGTVGSGWLTDRYDPRKLLAVYYSGRGLSLFVLPFVSDLPGLTVFAVVFGLDYIATVPPTAALVADRFGRAHVGVVFGWVFASHQLGAALAAWLGGVARDSLGDYTAAFLAAGILALLGAAMALRVGRSATPLPTAARAGV